LGELAELLHVIAACILMGDRLAEKPCCIAPITVGCSVQKKRGLRRVPVNATSPALPG
jgi:hypothetical protein